MYSREKQQDSFGDRKKVQPQHPCLPAYARTPHMHRTLIAVCPKSPGLPCVVKWVCPVFAGSIVRPRMRMGAFEDPEHARRDAVCCCCVLEAAVECPFLAFVALGRKVGVGCCLLSSYPPPVEQVGLR